MTITHTTQDRIGVCRWRSPVSRILLVAGTVFLASGLAAQPQVGDATVRDDIVRSAEDLQLETSSAADVALAGDRVRVDGTISDDLLAVGGDIRSTADIEGDSLTAGRDVKLEGTVAQSVFAAAMDLAITGTVGDDLYAIGRYVELADSAVVEGDASIAGGEVAVFGRVSDNLRIAAGETRLAGTVGGDVTVHGGEVHVLADARIDGMLTVNSAQAPDILDGAIIAGGVRHVEPADPERRSNPILDAAGSWLFGTVAATAIGAILLFVVPSITASVSNYLVSRPLASFGIGLLFVIAAMPVAVLLTITIVGIPFAFALFGGFMFTVLAAVPMFAVGMAIHLAARRGPDRPPPSGRTVAWLAGLSAALALVGLIPVAGPILLGLAATTAIGAFLKSLWDIRQQFLRRSDAEGVERATA